jgi:hypothetical protein
MSTAQAPVRLEPANAITDGLRESSMALPIIVEIVTVLCFYVVAFGNPVAPSRRDPSPWPILIIGTLIAAVLAYAHWH